MRVCPTCQRTYDDETLSFCREDGAQLDAVLRMSTDSATTLLLPHLGKKLSLNKNPSLTTQALETSPTYEQDGVCTISIEANWLDANGELAVCLAQPRLVTADEIVQDASRRDSLALAEEIFAIEEGSPRLSRWFGGKSGLVAFPEYAFGSGDFSALDALVRNYPDPLIVLAGFGATLGNSLQGLLESCSATWPTQRATPIDRLARYNAGWCWIHKGPSDTKCYIFLKNFLEQKIEISLTSGLTTGNFIMRLLARDVVIYPLLCADLACTLPNSARARIEKSLPLNNEGGPDANMRVIVATLLYTPKPYHPLWQPAINGIVGLQRGNAGLITVNQPLTTTETDANKDGWRCLSGGFINKAIMTDGPNPSLPTVRYVQTNSASGLILRQPAVGVACGGFRWVDSPTQGRNVWVPGVRRLFHGGRFVDLNEQPASQEFKRYVRRHRSQILGFYDRSSRAVVIRVLDQVISETDEQMISPRLWARLLTGVESNPRTFDVDAMDQLQESLDRALGGLASSQQATGAIPVKGTAHNGQLLWDDHEILVWKSPDHDCTKMMALLRASAEANPRERLLIVLGDGKTGYFAPQDVFPDRLDDITASRQLGNFSVDRVRHIAWRPLRDLENILAESNTSVEEKQEAILHQLSVN